jgi:hypothetical protein
MWCCCCLNWGIKRWIVVVETLLTFCAFVLAIYTLSTPKGQLCLRNDAFAASFTGVRDQKYTCVDGLCCEAMPALQGELAAAGNVTLSLGGEFQRQRFFARVCELRRPSCCLNSPVPQTLSVCIPLFSRKTHVSTTHKRPQRRADADQAN